MLPAWLGLGARWRGPASATVSKLLREMTTGWPFFATLLANAEMALAKADLGIARRYTQLWDDAPKRERIWALLSAEFNSAQTELMLIRGSERLLDSEPVLQASIDRRNPFVDPLSFVQIELLSPAASAADDGHHHNELGRSAS